MSKQTSLFKYGFKKRMQHRNQLFDVSGDDIVPNVSGVCKCDSCEKYFKSKQGLASHHMWHHPSTTQLKSSAELKTITMKLEKDVRATLDDLIERAVKSENSVQSISTDFSVEIDVTNVPDQRGIPAIFRNLLLERTHEIMKNKTKSGQKHYPLWRY